MAESNDGTGRSERHLPHRVDPTWYDALGATVELEDSDIALQGEIVVGVYRDALDREGAGVLKGEDVFLPHGLSHAALHTRPSRQIIPAEAVGGGEHGFAPDQRRRAARYDASIWTDTKEHAD